MSFLAGLLLGINLSGKTLIVQKHFDAALADTSRLLI
jgi:hypothetical protein